jgi:hypothetical protein
VLIASAQNCLRLSPTLIEHHLVHLNKGPFLVFNKVILLRHIQRGKVMLQSQRSTKGLEMSVLELCAIVTANRSHGILGKLNLQPKNQISSMSKSLIFRLHEEHPRIARKVVNNHKHISHPPEGANSSCSNSVHVKQFARLRSHHLGDRGMESSNHLVVMTWVTDKILFKFQLRQSLDQVK